MIENIIKWFAIGAAIWTIFIVWVLMQGDFFKANFF